MSIEAVSESASAVHVMGRFINASGTGTVSDAPAVSQLLTDVEPSKAVVMKLLYVEHCELTPPEVRYIADVSGRSIAEVFADIERLRVSVREREAAVKQEEDALEAVQAWIQLYQRRLQRVDGDLADLPAGSAAVARLEAERGELIRKIERRQRQREKLLAHARRRKVTAPYKEIAAILNTTTGNVGSQIARLRQELSSRLPGGHARAELGAKDAWRDPARCRVPPR